MNYAERTIQTLDLPLPDKVLIPLPEQVILKHGRYTVDVGAFCYRRRSKEARKAGKGTLVEVASFDPARAEQVRKLIKDMSDAVQVGGQRPHTWQSAWSRFMSFLAWCDNNDHQDVLQDEPSARTAFRQYAGLQERLVSQHLIQNRTGAQVLGDLAQYLNNFFGIDNITAGVRLLIRDERQTVHTKPADDERMACTISWAIRFLEGFTDLVVNHKPFPYALSVPAYVGFPDNRLWVIPAQRWALVPNEPTPKNGTAWNHFTGTIRSLEDTASVVEKVPGRHIRRSQIRQQIKEAKAILEAANNDPYSIHRTDRAGLAMAAFYFLLLAASGQNATPVVDLPWSTELEQAVMDANTTGAGFKSIKYRAQHKTIVFEIRALFLPFLRTYLRLRKYLLGRGNGQEFPYLFLTFGAKSQYSEPVQATSKVMDTLFKSACERFAVFKIVGAREMRATKADFVIRNGDVVLASKVLNNSRKTVEIAYSEGSPVTQATELSEHYDRMRRMMNTARTGEEERAIGGCKKPLDPIPIVADPPAKPNCRDGEGCLFCKHYRLHADEKDARKLLSARRCIRLIAEQPHFGSQYETVMSPVLQQLEFYVGLIRERQPELVARVEREVDEEDILDPFWLAKFESLIAIGMELL